MAATVQVQAGVCGFGTQERAENEDGQNVLFFIESDCDKIRGLATQLRDSDPIDAYAEIAPDTASRLLAICSEALPGCCAGCAVPVGLFKAMQVAAGLALPRDITIQLGKE